MNNNEVTVTFEDSTDSKAKLFVTIDEESKQMTMKMNFEPAIDWEDSSTASPAQKFAVWLLEQLKSIA